MPTGPTLDEYFATCETKYGDHIVPLGDGRQVTLQNSLRLERPVRKTLSQAQQRINRLQDDDETVQARELRDGEDQVDGLVRVLGEIITLVADDKQAAQDMLVRIGDNLPVLLEVFKDWQAQAQMGEA